MSANVFLNLLKRVFRNELIKLKNTGARMLVYMYHRTLKILWNHILVWLLYICNVVMGVIS